MDEKVRRDRQAMLSNMKPVLKDDVYYFCTTTDSIVIIELLPRSLAVFREGEGTTFILTKDDANQYGFDLSMPMRRIVLEVFSARDGIGLTAGVATALADEGIPYNVVAAYYHDNVFVPEHVGDQAVTILLDVQKKVNMIGD